MGDYQKLQKMHPCPKCDLELSTNQKLKAHMKSHQNIDPLQCDICQQTFLGKGGLAIHLTNNHGKEPSKRKEGSRLSLLPRFAHSPKESSECEVCERQFRLPSTLKVHMRLHTGERPYKCTECGERFRVIDYLRGHFRDVHMKKSKEKKASPELNIFKCLVCGKEGFKTLSNFSKHRRTVHAQVPYQNEKEKAFACGICGKPYFLREKAVICALLKHDPTPLRMQMFKIKCPECPPNQFGHRNLVALREHWEQVHKDKQIPPKFQTGISSDNQQEIFPKVTIDKKKAEKILAKGIPLKKDLGFPPFVELPLFETPKNIEKVIKNGVMCSICGKMLSHTKSLNTHMENVHGEGKWKTKVKPVECSVCGVKFSRSWSLNKHFKSNLHKDNVASAEKMLEMTILQKSGIAVHSKEDPPSCPVIVSVSSSAPVGNSETPNDAGPVEVKEEFEENQDCDEDEDFIVDQYEIGSLKIKVEQVESGKVNEAGIQIENFAGERLPDRDTAEIQPEVEGVSSNEWTLGGIGDIVRNLNPDKTDSMRVPCEREGEFGKCTYSARDCRDLQQHQRRRWCPIYDKDGRDKKAKKELEGLACVHCDMTFTIKSNLTRHLRRDHCKVFKHKKAKAKHLSAIKKKRSRPPKLHESSPSASEETQPEVETVCSNEWVLEAGIEIKNIGGERLPDTDTAEETQPEVENVSSNDWTLGGIGDIVRNLNPEKTDRNIFRCGREDEFGKCTYITRNRRDLQQHQRRRWCPMYDKEGRDKKAKKELEGLSCVHCDMKFTTKSNLKRHIKLCKVFKHGKERASSLQADKRKEKSGGI